MSLTRVFGRSSLTAIKRCRNLISPPSFHHHQQQLNVVYRSLHSLSNFSHKAPLFHSRLQCHATTLCRCGMSTSAPHEQENETKRGAANQADETDSSESLEETGSEVSLDDLSREELVKVFLEKKEVLQKKEKEFCEWKDKFLRSYAEIENVMERTRRDAENSKKFAVQSFAKSLLDVADNLSRASSVTKESFSKLDVSGDTVGAVPVLKTLWEGVEMTEKQLSEVFRKSGIEKVDPTNEQFDPNCHNAVFQVPDSSKPPGTVAVVLKAGYTLHDRIIRPAEVGVTVALENTEASS
ncbi:grpE protein homolog 1, mitochondrial-like [Silene latifolia]|uniref:grpE protein homolog 1, mitochondrial-like n=1 Tax=Silene latifolia TaxID=37657 RepID=UPI003D77DFA6